MRCYIYRVGMVREGPPGNQIIKPEGAAAIARAIIGPDADREKFVTLFLDARNRITGSEVVSVGSLNASLVHPREVFKAAILKSAAAIILVHNHPSGDVTPSRDDLDLTVRMVKAGQIIGIEVLDHLIIGGDEFLSFKERSLF